MRRPVLYAVLIVCVLTAGCSMFGPDPTRDERAVGALDNATDALAATESYRFDSDMTVSAGSRTEEIDLTGAVNATAREMRANVSSGGETRQAFVQNGTVYQECAEPWSGWGVEGVDDGNDWVNQTSVVRQLSLLESGSLYWNGTETLDGDQAVVLTGEPTADAITRYSDDVSQPLIGGPKIDDAELRVWLDAGTWLPLRTEIGFSMRARGETATAKMTTTFGDYGEPVSIDLPTGAQTNQYELGCPGES